MKRVTASLLAILIFLLLPVSAFAAEKERLYDGAELLTASEERALLSRMNEVSEKYRIEIVIATVEDTAGRDVDEYLEEYYDLGGYGFGASRDGALLLVSMAERDWRILSNGLGADCISPDDIDGIGGEVASYLSDGDYADAFHAFVDGCEYEIVGETVGHPFDWGKSALISLAIGLVIALIVTLCLKAQLKSVRSQRNAAEYVRAGSMTLTRSTDFYLYRVMNRQKRETNSSSSRSGGSRNIGGGKF